MTLSSPHHPMSIKGMTRIRNHRQILASVEWIQPPTQSLTNPHTPIVYCDHQQQINNHIMECPYQLSQTYRDKI